MTGHEWLPGRSPRNGEDPAYRPNGRYGCDPIYRWLAKGINAYMISLYPRRDTSTAADRPLNCDPRLLNECPFLMTIIVV